MDAGSWILLLIVAACVIALIVIGKKRIELEGSIFYRTDVDSSSSVSRPIEETEDLDQGPPQVTIYEYCSANKMRLCALCDGENDVSATNCGICGQPLD